METENKKVAEGNFQVAIPTGTEGNFQVAAYHNFSKRTCESSVGSSFCLYHRINHYKILLTTA
jgi:hypothetical protein